MDGIIKKIKNIFPVTTTKAVYIDGTNKTLQQAIDNREIGGTTTATTSGRGEAIFLLRGATINIRRLIENSSSSGNIKYSFPTGDTNRLRRLFVKTVAGETNTIDLPDGTLEHHQGLVYNQTSNSVEVRTGTWGNIYCTNNEYVLMYNCLGNISGLLAQYCNYGNDNVGFPIKDVEGVQIASTGSTQGIIVIDGTVYSCYHASDDHSAFDGNVGGKSQNICHMNAPSYNAIKDMLIVANGSKSFTLAMEGWVFPNWKTAFKNSEQLDINLLDKVTLDFSNDVFDGEYKAQLCWGEENGDIVYLATSDNRYIRKLQLCTGTTRGAYGNYIAREDNGYNGTYEILGTWYSRTIDIIGGMIYYKSNIYFGVKGDFGIRKCILKSDGYFDSEYIHISNKIGDMQGLAIYNNEVYAYTDSKGYKFSTTEL